MDDSTTNNKSIPTNSKLTNEFLKNLYQTKCSPSNINPILQILAFEQSLHEPHSQIMYNIYQFYRVRLSDGIVFIDCSLIGSYCISNGRIVSADSTQIQVQFLPKDLVKLTDFFSKIDNRRICQLRIMILKMQLAERHQTRIGYPSQLRQYFQNMKQGKLTSAQRQNNKSITNHTTNITSKRHKKQSHIIKIQQDLNQMLAQQLVNQQSKKTKQQKKQNGEAKSKIEKPTVKSNQGQQSLTYQQIINGKQGFFMGRLLRMKMANKQTKDGPMSVLYLGFIDRLGELVRINMAGRLAMKQQKELKKGKCYYIKDLQTYKTQKMAYPQIRIKDKDYRIIQVQQPALTQIFQKYYFHWDHQNQHIESDNVDIVGIIDDIQEKATYPNSNQKRQQKRQVVRVVVRNKFKTVKINFWAEQIKMLSNLKLKKKQAILLQDIKKKKNIFLDFQYQSSIIRLQEHPALKQQLKFLLPDLADVITQPKNIKQLKQIYQQQGSSNKVHVFRLFLSRMQENRIIYKLCNYCKKKVQKFAEFCQDCGKNQFFHKFNCQLQFADYSGSLCCVAFQFSAQKILGKTAMQISDMNPQQINSMIQQFSFQEYEIGIQNRNCRFIVRNAEPMNIGKHYIKTANENMNEILKILNKNKKN